MSRRAALIVLVLGAASCTDSGPPPPANGEGAGRITHSEVALGSSGADSPPPLPAKWAQHSAGLPFILGYQQGVQRARQAKKPIMFFVTATWCGWCKRLASESFRDPETRKLLENNFVLTIVDGDTEGRASAALGARGFPHVVFQSPAGSTLAVVRGYRPKAEFRSVVEGVLSRVQKG